MDYEKTVEGNAQVGVMMKPSPIPAFNIGLIRVLVSFLDNRAKYTYALSPLLTIAVWCSITQGCSANISWASLSPLVVRQQATTRLPEALRDDSSALHAPVQNQIVSTILLLTSAQVSRRYCMASSDSASFSICCSSGPFAILYQVGLLPVTLYLPGFSLLILENIMPLSKFLVGTVNESNTIYHLRR